jgi:NSS family neurotransmitter:Na+ symporter
MELLEEQRESWGTRGAFVLAAIGSAVGLGNLWGFPYKLYSFGGGAFLIPYVIAVLVVGIPTMILEFSLGHFTQRAAPDAFGKCHKKLEFIGWWCIIMGVIIITYYPVIMGYCLSFFWYSLKGIFNGGQLPWAGVGLEGVKNAKNFFNEYLGYHPSHQFGSIRWNVFWPLAISWLAMYLCIFRGVRTVGKVVWLTVPMPWLMLLILTVRGLTLDGSIQGLAYYLNPDWAQLAKPATWRYAFGQVFFSLSLGFGVMITYASFLHRKSDINNNAAIVSLSDTATSFVAGLAVFSTLGGMAYATQAAGNPIRVENVVDGGPGLAFVAFPYALAQLPHSAWFSLVFFTALITLGIDSAFSITETVLASIVDKTGWNRSVVLVVMSILGLFSGLIYTTQGGLNWLGTIDAFVNGAWGIVFVGMLECMLLGWVYRVDNFRCHANSRSDWQLGRWWTYLVRIFIPIILGIMFMWSLFDDFSNPQFLMLSGGRPNWPNWVGLIVVGLSPVIAVVLSCIKSPFQEQQAAQNSDSRIVKGTKSAVAGLVVTAVSAILFFSVLLIDSPGYFKQVLLVATFLSSLSGLLMSNSILEKYDTSKTRPSALAILSAIGAIFVISAAVATVLVSITKSQQAKTPLQQPAVVALTGISYVIIGAMTLLIVGGLGWCFYKSIGASNRAEPVQMPGEVD